MRSIFAIILFLCISANSATAEECKVDNWKFTQVSSETGVIEGTTTCLKGSIIIRVFDGDKWIGNAVASIHGFTFNTMFSANAPKQMSIKYVVQQH